MEQSFEELRKRMVETQLKTRGIKSAETLDAMSRIPRHLFVPGNLQNHAYDDSPLPIGLGQTISQPYIVAFMTEQLEPFPGMKILEIGTGSGYQTAVLACLACEVHTIELLEDLVFEARKTLAILGLSNVNIIHGNGYSGLPSESPFDAIIVTAAPKKIPENLIDQLKSGGRMILPVGQASSVQQLTLITKKDKQIIRKELIPVRFVPMVE